VTCSWEYTKKKKKTRKENEFGDAGHCGEQHFQGHYTIMPPPTFNSPPVHFHLRREGKRGTAFIISAFFATVGLKQYK